jgi:hypothetical protein
MVIVKKKYGTIAGRKLSNLRPTSFAGQSSRKIINRLIIAIRKMVTSLYLYLITLKYIKDMGNR